MSATPSETTAPGPGGGPGTGTQGSRRQRRRPAPQATVLYDAPGPRARRRSLVVSVAVTLGALGALGFVGWRLAQQGQFEAELWQPLFDPRDEDFASVWRLLLAAIGRTLLGAVLAIAASLALGTVIAVARYLLGRVTRSPIVALVELLRGLPVVIAIFYAGRVLPSVGADLPTIAYLVIGLTGYNMVVIAEILRAGIAALPKGQTEAALAIGLTRVQSLALVVLPQAFRIMLPALISQLVVIVKDTSLAALVLAGFIETLTQGRLLSQILDNPIQSFILVAGIFIVINSTLSWLATVVERRLRERTPA